MAKKLLLLLLFILLLSGCTIGKSTAPTVSVDVYHKEENKVEVNIPDPIEIQISAVGDIMIHGPQLKAQYDSTTKEYDFKNNFQFVKPYLEKADIALCNLETTLAGEDMGYSSFPKFKSPDAILDAISDAGFDVVITANNHTIDSGRDGVLRTIKVIKDSGLDITGTQKNYDDENFIIKDVHGIKLGIIAYTYETPQWGENKTLNSLKIPKGFEEHINTFNYDDLDNEVMKMKNEIDKMKEKGAEFIIFYIHWGEEYQRKPNPYQLALGKSLSTLGVDIIFGSHPHVLQPVEIIKNDDKDTFVVYSMGNFLSNQRYEILKNRYTEDGIIINVTIRKDFEENKIKIKKVDFVPTWVHRYPRDGKMVYEILPLEDALRDPISYHLNNENSIWRSENSQKNTLELIKNINF